MIIIILETLLPQICKRNFSSLDVFLFDLCFLDDPLAPVSKLTDALNRVRSDVISIPAICGKAYFSIRIGKYSTALELLNNIDREDGKILFSYN